MKSIKDFEVKNKRVLMRCDFNVPLDKGQNILHDFRILETIPTIKYLIEKQAKIILISHLGKPESAIQQSLSLAPVQKKLNELLDIPVVFVRDCIGKQVEQLSKKIKPGEILLLENLRFHKQESENDLDFAKNLAKLGDIYINEAFSVSHRAHASLVGVPKFLPSGIGLLFEKEIQGLSKILENPKRPLVGIIGGTKPSKIKSIKNLLEKVDFLLIGGKIANIILRAKGISIGKPLPGPEIMQELDGLDLTSPKLRLPFDVIAVLDGVYVRKAGAGAVNKQEKVLDIGPETVKMFSQIIRQAKTIFWAGPLGKIEEKRFSMGSLGVARAIVNTKAYSTAGGRETISFLKDAQLLEKFNHISTAGGAMLKYLSKGTLPAIEVLS